VPHAVGARGDVLVGVPELVALQGEAARDQEEKMREIGGEERREEKRMS
jgi:hypothetical protein